MPAKNPTSLRDFSRPHSLPLRVLVTGAAGFIGSHTTDQLLAEGCRVIGYQETTTLTFTWNAPPQLPLARAQRTVVLLRLRPVEVDRTRVELTQVGWGDGGEWDEAFGYFDAAWRRVLERLGAWFEGAEELPGT